MIKRLTVVILFLGLVLSALFGYRFHQIREMAARMSAPRPPATVASATVTPADWQPFLNSVGSVVADSQVFVSNEIAGIVIRINFGSGDTVKVGRVLVQLDDSVDRAELEGLIAARTLARLEFARNAKLLRDRSVSRSEYDRAQAALEQATAQVEAKQALIRKKAIKAPFTGRLGIRQVNLGEYLEQGSQIVSLQALIPIHVDYTVPERELARLHKGQTAAVSVQAYPQTWFTGKVVAIDPRIDRRTRNIRIRATFPNTDHRLHPGMFAEVHTLLPVRRGVLTLPRTAISYAPYGESVFLIEEHDGALTVHRRQIHTGAVREGRVEVVEGLKAGDRVVNGGQVKLRNGEAVKIDNSISLDTPAAGP